tara:strand:- start:483 stop:728 length:246 start_codon:yes stop_codon:yes gene_type:complete
MKTKAQILGITDFPYEEHDKDGNETYCEYSDGEWCKTEFNDKGRITYRGWDDGDWYGSKFNNDNNRIYFEHSDGEKQYNII